MEVRPKCVSIPIKIKPVMVVNRYTMKEVNVIFRLLENVFDCINWCTMEIN